MNKQGDVGSSMNILRFDYPKFDKIRCDLVKEVEKISKATEKYGADKGLLEYLLILQTSNGEDSLDYVILFMK